MGKKDLTVKTGPFKSVAIILRKTRAYLFLVCALPAYKRKGLYYMPTSFNDSVFSIDDIFDDINGSDSAFKSFRIKPITTVFFGRCYSLQLLTPVRDFDFNTKLRLKTTFDVDVYIHPPGANPWSSKSL